MGKPRREGKGWSIRVQRLGQDIYLSGFNSAKAAQEAMRQRLAELGQPVPPKHGSPSKLTMAAALRLYALERLPHLKGAPQEARRINRYLNAAQMAPVECEPVALEQRHETGAHYQVTVAPGAARRLPPASLRGHRQRLASRTATSDRLRAALARTPVAKVTRHQVQAFLDALAAEGLAPATCALERALLRRLLTYARTVWHWPINPDNPATRVAMRSIDNNRERVLSLDEEQRLEAALLECRNPQVAPAIILLLETAMRSSEPLQRAAWGDVDWNRCILHLRDSKSGKRDVPLSERAMDALRKLGPGAPDAPILPLSYEALKAAWKRVCERAALADLRIHDLRHTAATRMALATGNVFLVKALTGHKTFSQLERYINVTADDVVRAQRATRPGPGAGGPVPSPVAEGTRSEGSAVIYVDFGRRSA